MINNPNGTVGWGLSRNEWPLVPEWRTEREVEVLERWLDPKQTRLGKGSPLEPLRLGRHHERLRKVLSSSCV